jgi:two-component system sensor kinase FixL
MIDRRKFEEKNNFMVLTTNSVKKKITRKKEIEIQKKVAEFNELKSRFVATASHEFRTPLGAVLSSAYLVGKYRREDEQELREKHLHKIVTSVKFLTEILGDLLAIGKIEEGKVSPNLVYFDVKDQMMETIQEIYYLYDQQKKIDYVHMGEESKVILDMGMLNVIMHNLLSNAIKFSGEQPVIDVRTEMTDRQFIITIKDYGIGIPEKEHSNLFMLFYRSSNAINVHGKGLGLYVAKKCIETMKGSIDFSSEPGKGTTFIIKFNRITTRLN